MATLRAEYRDISLYTTRIANLLGPILHADSTAYETLLYPLAVTLLLLVATLLLLVAVLLRNATFLHNHAIFLVS